MFIDIHTHNSYSPQANINFYIQNLFLQHTNSQLLERYKDRNKFVSIGLHPWHIEEYQNLTTLEELINHPNVIAIGETGLDRFISTPIEIQSELFQTHISLSEKYHKPLIIHSVRSYADILRIRKQCNQSIPWIIHGYMGNMQIAQQLSKMNCYLSFGKALLQNRPKTEEAFIHTDNQRVFFETDEENDSILPEVYTKGALLKNIPLEKLQSQVFCNFEEIFGKIL